MSVKKTTPKVKTEIQDAINASEKKSFEDIKEFLDLSPFGVLYLDDANRITGINSTAANYLESSKEELLGKSIFDFLQTKDESSLNKESIKDFILNNSTTFKTRKTIHDFRNQQL